MQEHTGLDSCYKLLLQAAKLKTNKEDIFSSTQTQNSKKAKGEVYLTSDKPEKKLLQRR